MRYLFSVLIALFLIFFGTFFVYAAKDSSITSVTVSLDSSEVGDFPVKYNVLVQTSAPTTNLTCLIFENIDPTNSDFGGVPAISPGVILSSTTQQVFDGSEASSTVFGASFQDEGFGLDAGALQFSLTNIKNPTTDGTYTFGCTTDASIEDAEYTQSAEFNIGDGNSAINVVDEVNWSSSSSILNEKANYVFEITTNTDLVEGSSLTFFFVDVNDSTVAPADIGVDFSNATFCFNDFTAEATFSSREEDNKASASLNFDSTLTVGAYTFTICDVVNPSTVSTLIALMTSTPNDADTSVTSNSISFTELEVPVKPKKKKMKVKKKAKKYATLNWADVSGADTYTLQVTKCKNDLRKKCKKVRHFQKKKRYRKFKNFTKSQKKVKKLKKGVYYRWRVKACNDAGCSKFTGWKRYVTRG